MKVMKPVVALAFFLVPIQANSTPECLRSASSVREHYNAWPIWSKQVLGHKHQKCWFPVEKHRNIYAKSDRHVAQSVAWQSKNSLTYNELQEYSEDTWDALTAMGSPQQRIDATFHYLENKWKDLK